MPRLSNLPKLNEHGDNGWWRIIGSDCAHYFQDKRPTCGWMPMMMLDRNLKQADRFDHKCKNCSKVRRNLLIIRMNAVSQGYETLMIAETVDMPSPTRAIRFTRLTVNPGSRRTGTVLVERKGGRLSTPREDVCSFWLAVSYLGLLVIYEPVTSFIHGGTMLECYGHYAEVVILFAVVGVVFFIATVFYLAIELLERIKCPKKR